MTQWNDFPIATDPDHPPATVAEGHYVRVITPNPCLRGRRNGRSLPAMHAPPARRPTGVDEAASRGSNMSFVQVVIACAGLSLWISAATIRLLRPNRPTDRSDPEELSTRDLSPAVRPTEPARRSSGAPDTRVHSLFAVNGSAELVPAVGADRGK